MKKLIKILLLLLILNLFNSLVYAGPTDFPQPDSVDPTIVAMGVVNI